MKQTGIPGRLKSERRHTNRVVLLCPAKIRFRDQEVSALCSDFSTGGLGMVVESLYGPNQGEAIDVHVELPKGRQFEAGAQVMHVGKRRPDKIGISFSRLDRNARTALASVVG